jgi:hypothetical protein
MQIGLWGWAMKSQSSAEDMSIGGRLSCFFACARAGAASARTIAATAALNQILIGLLRASVESLRSDTHGEKGQTGGRRFRC